MISAQQADAELNRRFEAAKLRVTPEAIANGHAWQLKVLLSTALSLLLMCSRRAGKSRVACGLLLLTAMATPNVSCLYLALTKGQAQIILRRHMMPMIRKFKVPHHPAGQTLTFPNGSTIVFGGTDDLKTVTHLLGDSLAGGIAVLDEQQDDPGILEQTARDILGPMINETTAEHPKPGRIVISGTVPDIEAGYFMKLWSENYDEDEQRTKPDATWECYTWSRFDNPFQRDNEWHLEVHLKKYRLTREDPTVQRAWYGRRVWDKSETAFNYRSAINQWIGKRVRWFKEFSSERFKLTCVDPPAGIDTFWIGIDPAQAVDRFALTLFGTCSTHAMGIWQVAEAVSPAGADPYESEWIAVVREWKERYGRVARVIRDPGSNQETIDVLLRSHGILIEPAIKGPGSLKGRVDRVRDLLMLGELHVLAGSALEADLIATKWSKKARQRGKWEFDSSCHPDVADSASYIIPAWTSAKKKRDPLAKLSEDDRAAREAERDFEKRYRDFKPGTKQKRKQPNPWARGPHLA